MAAPTTQLVNEGQYWKYTPVADVAAGDIIEIVNSTTVGFIGHASLDIAADKQGSLLVEGVVEFDLLSGDEPTLGALMYWNAATLEATETAGTDCLIGRCAEAWVTGNTRVRVDINQR